MNVLQPQRTDTQVAGKTTSQYSGVSVPGAAQTERISLSRLWTVGLSRQSATRYLFEVLVDSFKGLERFKLTHMERPGRYCFDLSEKAITSREALLASYSKSGKLACTGVLH